MAGTMMVERTGVVNMPGMTTGMGPAGVPGSTTMPTGVNWMMVPRCTFKVEKCSGGMKINCVCDDKMACSMLQNLCAMLTGGMCGCCVTMNGVTVFCCNFTMGLCKCETTDNGVCFTCTSGDPQCCSMIQSFCECLNTSLKAGCSCCVMLNNTPVCCGCA